MLILLRNFVLSRVKIDNEILHDSSLTLRSLVRNLNLSTILATHDIDAARDY